MNIHIIITAVSLILLVSASAFFSGSESAFTSLTKSKLRRFSKSRNPAERRIAQVLKNPSKLITTILIGNNLVNNWASSLATALAISIMGEKGLGTSTVLMTIIIILFGEITPKTFATQRCEAVARFSAPLNLLLLKLLAPLVLLFSVINNVFISLLHVIAPEKNHRISEDELKTIMDVGKREGILEEGEHQLLHRAFDFTDLKIREIMVPRTAIAAIRQDCSILDARAVFRSQHYTRMPVYSDTIDTITGIINYRDVLFGDYPADTTVKQCIRHALFVPETQTASELLHELKKNHEHLAIVIDEHGATAGLITLHNAISAVFGGLQDDMATDLQLIDQIQIISPQHIRVPGALKLDDLNTLLGTKLDSEFYETLSGFLMETAGRFPVVGEPFASQGLLFAAEEIDGRKITSVSIRFTGKENLNRDSLHLPQVQSRRS